MNVSWEETRKNWGRIKRGAELYHCEDLFTYGLVLNANQPWLFINIIQIFFSIILLTYFLICGAVTIFLVRHDLLTLVEVAHGYTFVLTLWILLVVHYGFKMPKTYELLTIMGEGIYRYETDYSQEKYDQLEERSRYYCRIFQKVYRAMICLLVFILAIIAPIIIRIYSDDSPRKISSLNYSLPIPLWQPYDTHTSFGFTLAYFLICLEIFVCGFYIAAGIPFVITPVIEIKTQYEILEHLILNLKHCAEERYKSYRLEDESLLVMKDDLIYIRCLKDSINENVKHHVSLLKFLDTYQYVTSSVYGVLIAASLTVLASMSLVFTKVDLFSFTAVKFFTFFIAELAFVFFYCFLGTLITEESIKIPNALYHCPWYELSEYNKRTLKIFQLMTTNEIVLKGSGLFNINLDLFVQIVQTTYSIYNIFSTLVK